MTCQAFDDEELTAVKANVLLLVGELVYQLKMESLTHLTEVVPKILSTLQQQELLQRYVRVIDDMACRNSRSGEGWVSY